MGRPQPLPPKTKPPFLYSGNAQLQKKGQIDQPQPHLQKTNPPFLYSGNSQLQKKGQIDQPQLMMKGNGQRKSRRRPRRKIKPMDFTERDRQRDQQRLRDSAQLQNTPSPHRP